MEPRYLFGKCIKHCWAGAIWEWVCKEKAGGQTLGAQLREGSIHHLSSLYADGPVHACVWVASVVSDSLRPMDCSPPGFSLHGILQARRLEWVARLSSKGSSQPRDQARIFCMAGRIFNHWAAWGAWAGGPTEESNHAQAPSTSPWFCREQAPGTGMQKRLLMERREQAFGLGLRGPGWR